MITLQEVLQLHTYSIDDFGGSHGIRDTGLLESAVERPSATFGGEEFYPTAFTKAAAILESIVKNHPFVDGNKRTGWLACVVMMRLYDYKFTLSQDDAYDFVIRVASSHLEFENIVEYIEMNVKRIN
jgi:death-on-curing protein